MTINPIQSSDGYVQATNIAKSTQQSDTNFSATAKTTSGSAAIQATRYLSPVLKIDPQTHIAIYEERDPSTGTVLNQYPSQKVVEQYQKADQQSNAPLTDQTTSNAPATASSPAPVQSVAPQDVAVVKVGLSSVITAGVTTGPQVEPAGNYTE